MILPKTVIRDVDKGFKRIVNDLESFENLTVEAGIFEGENLTDSDITMAALGAIHEYGAGVKHGRSGSMTITVPERSWIRSTFKEKSAKWEGATVRALSAVITRGTSIFLAFTAVGERMASDLRRKITTLREPPNAPSTIEKKGSSNPLIDTGAMRQSVRSRMKL